MDDEQAANLRRSTIRHHSSPARQRCARDARRCPREMFPMHTQPEKSGWRENLLNWLAIAALVAIGIV